MTNDRDFKRLVRQRMAKTGESYTTARAHLRPSGSSSDTSIEEFRALYERTGLDRLTDHLEARYGIDVKRLTELDVGVFRVDRRDGPNWVARAFPDVRWMDNVEIDAAILRFLEASGFVAERCAHGEPVSVVDGQGVLVTDHLAGANARTDFTGQTLFSLGETLGRLHTLPDAESSITRPAGGWHHISPNGGGLRADVELLLPLLAGFEEGVDPRDQEAFVFVREALRSVDGCDDLPRALIHPSPCGANAIVSTSGAPVFIDWTGAGRGPRLLSLGALLGASLQPAPGVRPSRELRRIDAIIAGYRAHARLSPDELARLAPAIAGSGIVLDCWCLLFQDAPVHEIARSIADLLAMSQRVSERVVDAFDADEETLTGWYVESPPAVHPGQGALF